jgi:hypothetical protein
MKDFSKITLVSVTGLPDATRAIYALTLRLRQMPGARAVLCSPQAPASLPPGIEHRKIAPLNYQEYSWFMMYALWRVVETEFALIVQDDGWVLDTANWTDDFLDYDYVGPWRTSDVSTPAKARAGSRTTRGAPNSASPGRR